MQKKERNIILILSIVFALIVLVGGFFFLKQNKQYTDVVGELTLDRDNLAHEFQDLMFEYDSLKPQNDTLLVMLDKEQQKVAQLLEELETVKVTNAAKMREMRKELGTMRKVLRHYVVTIDSLNTVNQELTRENEVVRHQHALAMSEVKKLEKQREELEETVTLAKQLEANQIVVETLSTKNRSTKRLSKIARFKVSFNLSKNITTEPGLKPVYLRIMGPNQEVFFENETDVFHYEDKDINYTSKRVVEYEGEEVPVSIFWDVNRYLFAGEFTIDIFADGYRIGTTSIIIQE